jgi:predicted DNA-binding protein
VSHLPVKASSRGGVMPGREAYDPVRRLSTVLTVAADDSIVTPMAETPLYSFRMNVRLKEQLQRIAEAEGRTLSYLIDRVLSEFAAQYVQDEIGKRRKRG